MLFYALSGDRGACGQDREEPRTKVSLRERSCKGKRSTLERLILERPAPRKRYLSWKRPLFTERSSSVKGRVSRNVPFSKGPSLEKADPRKAASRKVCLTEEMASSEDGPASELSPGHSSFRADVPAGSRGKKSGSLKKSGEKHLARFGFRPFSAGIHSFGIIGWKETYSAGCTRSRRLSIRFRHSSLPMNDVTSYMPGPFPAPTNARRRVFITWPMP